MIWHVSTEGVLNLDTPVQLTLFSWQSIPWLYWFVSFFQKHGLTGSFQEPRDIRPWGEAGSRWWVPANTCPGQKGSYHWTVSWGRPEGVGKDGAKWEEHGWTVLARSCYAADHVNILIWSRGRGGGRPRPRWEMMAHKEWAVASAWLKVQAQKRSGWLLQRLQGVKAAEEQTALSSQAVKT